MNTYKIFTKTMLTLSCLLIFVFMLNTGMAILPASDSTVIIIPHWQKGEIKKYEILYTTTVSFYNTTIISEITQVVKDVNDTNIELEWRYDTIKQIDSLPKSQEQLQKSSPQFLLMGRVIKYRTDVYGRIREILNFNELSKQLKTDYDSTISSFMRLMNPQYFENFLLKDLLTFHQLYGQKIKYADTTLLNLQYSIKPDIHFKSRSISINFKHDLPTGFFSESDLISIEGRYQPLPSIINYSFNYVFRTSTNLLERYYSVIKSAVKDNLIIDECTIKLIP